MDSVVNQGLPAPLDIQVSGSDMLAATRLHRSWRLRQGSLPVSDVLIPQDVDFPGLELNIDRQQASLLGLSQKMSSTMSSPRSLPTA